jgi:hypothetical protein
MTHELTGSSYNAAIFKVITSNEWVITLLDIRSNQYNAMKEATMADPNTSLYWHMGKINWIQPYNKKYVSDRGDLYLIIDRIAFDTSQPYNQTWQPDDLSFRTRNIAFSLRDLTLESTDWLVLPLPEVSRYVPRSVHVAEAFSKKVDSQSRVQISLYFMIIVLIFNTLKLTIMALVLLTDRSAYLVTFGDAVASFLKRPDPYTDRMCMLGKEELFTKMGLPPLHPVLTEEEANDLRQRLMGTWLPRPRSYMFSINRHGKVVYTML